MMQWSKDMFEKFCYKQKKNCWFFSTRKMSLRSPALATEKWALDVIKESLEQWLLIPAAYLNYVGKL